jgi:hypothetical protein
MEICILRKVPFRIPGTKRLVWAIILAERGGLSLLFVQKPDDKRSHILTIATENVTERVFEEVNASRFQIEHSDLADIGKKLLALGDGMSDDDFRRFFRLEDDW